MQHVAHALKFEDDVIDLLYRGTGERPVNSFMFSAVADSGRVFGTEAPMISWTPSNRPPSPGRYRSFFRRTLVRRSVFLWALFISFICTKLIDDCHRPLLNRVQPLR